MGGTGLSEGTESVVADLRSAERKAFVTTGLYQFAVQPKWWRPQRDSKPCRNREKRSLPVFDGPDSLAAFCGVFAAEASRA